MKPATIDIHAHYFPESFFRLIDEAGAPFGARVDRSHSAGPVIDMKGTRTVPLDATYWDLDRRRKAMDKAGVQVHALSLTAPMVYFADAPTGARLARAVNDAMDAAHTAFPDRFVGCATLPMQDPNAAVAELERVTKLRGIRGIYLGTNVNNRELSDAAYGPVWERCQAAKLPVLLHPLTVIGAGNRLSKFYLNNFLGNPFDTAIAAAHLVFGGVLDRFPKLEVVLPHAGGAFAWLVGRLNRGWEKRQDLKHIRQAPVDYLRRFHYDTIGYADPVVDYLVRTVGADRIVMGSDYCFPIAYEQPVDVVTANPLLSAQAKEAILAGNARRLLKL